MNKYCPVLVISASTTTLVSPSSTKFGSRGLVFDVRRRLLPPSPSTTEFGSRGSPSTLATTTSASSSSIQFDLRGSPSTSAMTSAFARVGRARSGGLAFYFGDHDFGFALVDRVRLEGLAVCLRRPRLWLRPRRQSSARGGSPSMFSDYFGFALVDTIRLEGLALYFGDDFGLRPRRQSSTRGARLLLRRRLLPPSPSTTEFGSRGSPSTWATTTSASSSSI